MKAFRRQRGQCSVGDHYFSRCPTLAREASGDVTERPPFGVLIGKSYDYHAWSIMALGSSSKPGFRIEHRKNRIALAPAFDQHPPMLARVLSAAVNGIGAFPAGVEVNCGWGDTVIVIVGLSEAAAKEPRDRVPTELINSRGNFTSRQAVRPAPGAGALPQAWVGRRNMRTQLRARSSAAPSRCCLR